MCAHLLPTCAHSHTLKGKAETAATGSHSHKAEVLLNEAQVQLNTPNGQRVHLWISKRLRLNKVAVALIPLAPLTPGTYERDDMRNCHLRQLVSSEKPI